MRLIDADALKEDLIKFFPIDCLEGIESKTLFNQILTDIDNAPTVEPDMAQVLAYESGKASAERPQGEWKTNMTTGDVFCSCCKSVRRDTRINHINFCNSCGADMRKGEEE